MQNQKLSVAHSFVDNLEFWSTRVEVDIWCFHPVAQYVTAIGAVDNILSASHHYLKLLNARQTI